MANNYLKITHRDDEKITGEDFVFFDDTDHMLETSAVLRAVNLLPADRTPESSRLSVFRRLPAHPSIPVIGDMIEG